MGRTYSIRRRLLKGIIVIILTIVLSPGLDMNTALLISLGFGASISLWSLSYIHEPSFICTRTYKN